MIGIKLPITLELGDLEPLEIGQHRFRGSLNQTFEYDVGTYLFSDGFRTPYQHHWSMNLTLGELGYKFEYRPDPIVSHISPNPINYYQDSRRWKNVIHIHGQHMDSVPIPLILVDLDENGSFESLCEIENSTRWRCPLPTLSRWGQHSVTVRTADNGDVNRPTLPITLCPPPQNDSFLNESLKITDTEPRFVVSGANFCSDIEQLIVTSRNVTICTAIDQISTEKFVCHVNTTLFEQTDETQGAKLELPVFIESKLDLAQIVCGIMGLIFHR